MSSSRLLLFGCLVFIAGIIAGSFDYHILVLAGIFTSILIAIRFFGFRSPAVIGQTAFFVAFGGLIFIFGVYKTNLSADILQRQTENIHSYFDKEIELTGVVAEEPRRKSASRLYILNLGEINASFAGNNEIISGVRIIAYLPLYPEFYLGDKLKIKGKLKIPDSVDFDWRGYLAKEKVSAALSFPKSVERISSDVFCDGQFLSCATYRLKSGMIEVRKKFEAIVLNSLPPPEGTIAGALMLGDNSFYLSEYWREKMNLTGTRHLVAISGSNITLVGNIIFAALIAVGFWRRRAMWIVIAGIITFVFFVGSPASAVRAGIMGGILIFAQGIGRPAAGTRLLLIAAAFMLLQNPSLFRFDIGFQLSFAAVLGLIYIQPILASYFLWFEKSLALKFVKDAGAMTLAAQIATLPVSLYHFGTFSVAAPFTNLILVPLITFITAYGFFWTILGFISLPLALIFSFPSWIMMRFFTGVVNFFYGFSFAAVRVAEFPLWAALVVGLAIIALTYKFSGKKTI